MSNTILVVTKGLEGVRSDKNSHISISFEFNVRADLSVPSLADTDGKMSNPGLASRGRFSSTAAGDVAASHSAIHPSEDIVCMMLGVLCS